MRLKTRIRELRKQMKISQTKLAEMVGVSRETISHTENGKFTPSIKLGMDIAKVFDKPVEEVFFFVDEEEDENEEEQQYD